MLLNICMGTLQCQQVIFGETGGIKETVSCLSHGHIRVINIIMIDFYLGSSIHVRCLHEDMLGTSRCRVHGYPVCG